MYQLLIVLVLINQAISHQHQQQVLGTWLPNYGDSDTNFIMNDTVASNTMELLKGVGANTVYIDVWHDGVTGFPSPTWENATGLSWTGTDYLSFPITEAKKRGLRAIAWFEYGLMYSGPLLDAHPEWSMGQANGFTWMDPSNPLVQSFIKGILVDAIRHNPSIDGIQLDDHFAWPDQLGHPTLNTKSDIMTNFMTDIFHTIKAEQSSVLVSLAPNPIDYSTSNYNVPWNVWLEMGIIEDAVVQLYTTDYASFCSKFDEQIASISPISFGLEHLKAGILLNDGNTPTPWDSVSMMMNYEFSQGWSGQVLWYARGILEMYYNEVKGEWLKEEEKEEGIVHN